MGGGLVSTGKEIGYRQEKGPLFHWNRRGGGQDGIQCILMVSVYFDCR